MVGVIVALDDGIYHVVLAVGPLLRLRRLSDGRIRCLGHHALRLLLAGHQALVLATRPGRFSVMTPQELGALHSRLPLVQGDEPCFISMSREP